MQSVIMVIITILNNSIPTFHVMNIGRSILEATAKHLEVKPTVSTSYSQTRFASSAYVQWQRLVQSYRLFTTAMKNAAPALSDELHPLQYQVLGQVRSSLAESCVTVVPPKTLFVLCLCFI